MPMYDRKCTDCNLEQIDLLEAIISPDPRCPKCPGVLIRFWKGGYANGVIADGIPGGVEIRNGICWPDGTPRRYYSHSEMKREADRQGLVNRVRHVGSKGSDKSKHTSRWI